MSVSINHSEKNSSKTIYGEVGEIYFRVIALDKAYHKVIYLKSHCHKTLNIFAHLLNLVVFFFCLYFVVVACFFVCVSFKYNLIFFLKLFRVKMRKLK